MCPQSVPVPSAIWSWPVPDLYNLQELPYKSGWCCLQGQSCNSSTQPGFLAPKAGCNWWDCCGVSFSWWGCCGADVCALLGIPFTFTATPLPAHLPCCFPTYGQWQVASGCQPICSTGIRKPQAVFSPWNKSECPQPVSLPSYWMPAGGGVEGCP